MDFIHVVCTVSILLSPGQPTVVDLRGVVVKEYGDYLYVDFSKEFLEKKYRNDIQPRVIKVNGNRCLYEK